MYNFILNQWRMEKYTREQVQLCVTKKYITQVQADVILDTPQLPQNAPINDIG